MKKEHWDSLRQRLAGRICEDDIHELACHAQGTEGEMVKQALYSLMFDEDKRVADNAAWVFTHFDLYNNRWLYNKHDELIEESMRTVSNTKRRLLLNLLTRQPFYETDLRADFLDFCLHGMMSVEEPTAIRSLCMKLAYKQCCFFPELLSELRETLGIMEPALLSPGLRTTRKKTLADIEKEIGLDGKLSYPFV